MIFAKHLVGKIKRGETTTTIRPRPLKVNARHCVKASQKGDIACHIIITDVRETPAGQVSFKEARAAGHRTSAEWRLEWVRQQDKNWIARTEQRLGRELTEFDLQERFDTRHTYRPVYVVAFALAVDTPRFLADQRVSHRGASDDGQYTSSRHRAVDDLEAIDEMTQKRYAERARKVSEEQRASFKRDLEAERARRKADRGRSFRMVA